MSQRHMTYLVCRRKDGNRIIQQSIARFYDDWNTANTHLIDSCYETPKI